MEIIDLCSDGEDDINSSSNGEDSTHLGSDRRDSLGPDDPSDGGDRSLVPFNTRFGQNYAEQPISLDDDWWLNSNLASSSYRSPAVSAHRIYPISSSSVMLHDSSYSSNSLEVLTENDDDDIYMHWQSSNQNVGRASSKKTHYFVLSWAKNSLPLHFFGLSWACQGPVWPQQSSATVYMYSVLPQTVSDNMVKDEPNYFGRSAANGVGMSSSKMSADWKLPFGNCQKVETDSDNDDVYAYEGPHSHRTFTPSMPSWNSVDGTEGLNGFGTQSHPNVESRPFGCDERAIYEEALQHISQETKEEDLPEGVMSLSLLKHQKIALAWMLSKENSSHCPGGILADDQGPGKTISAITVIQKERVQQSKFMSADSDSKSSVSLHPDEDNTMKIVNKKEMKGEPSDMLASNIEYCSSRSGTAVDRVAVEVKPKKKTRVRLPSSTSTLRSTTNVESRPSGCDERAIYEEALQPGNKGRTPEGVMSVSLLKHQKIALAWMLSKENSSHCPGGILADDQGPGKTISAITVIQKERVQQSKFMSADSDSKSSVSLHPDEDNTMKIVNKKEMKGEPSDMLASNIEYCSSRSGTAVDRVAVEVKPKKKTRVRLPSSTSTLRSTTNVESRPSGCDERAIYEEALQPGNKGRTPEGVMSVSLLKHQKIALAWMLSKENSSHCPGGILADDQGLGKTISIIALIQKERVQQSKFMSADSDSKSSVSLDPDEDNTMMIVNKKEMKGEPSDMLASNIEYCASRSGTAVDRVAVEVKPKKKTRVRFPSSTSTLRSATKPSAGTLVVCPASILKQWASEISAKVTESSKLSVLVYHGGSRTTDPTELAKYDVVVTTYTIVGHEVPKQDSDDDMEQKNSEKYGICPDFSAGNKGKLPKETKKKVNNKKKLNSSGANLEGGPLSRVRWFRVVLDEAQTIKNHRTKSARACCGLIAKRRWCLSGTPMQNKIDDLYSYFRFFKYEPYSAYTSFHSMIKNPISKGSSQGYKKLQTVLKIVLLRRTKETLLDGEPIIKIPPKKIELNKINFTQEERYFYLALEEGSRQKFKKFAAAGTIQQNYTNILVLLLRLRQACDHPFLLKDDNHANFTNPGSIEMAKQLPREIVINLLEKLEARHPICLICAKHEERTKQKEPPENAVITTCCHIFCYECVLQSLSEEDVCPVCKQKLSAELVFSRPVLRLCLSDELKSYAITSCSAPADESSAAADESSAAADESSSICEKSYISSKVQAAVDTLNSIFNTPALTDSDTIESSTSEIVPKAIVFSQWTGMLDVLELTLNSNFIKFRRLDGSMSLDVRGAAVEEFKTNPEVRVMLMSLKAGNVGLNMTAASHVIMLDPWWNPYAEDQAVDRAHRIGQTQPVTVTRFTVNGTVEDRILALQAKKREMVESAFAIRNLVALQLCSP